MAEPAKKLSVLVIDDDLLMRELLVALMEAEELTVVTAESRDDVIEVLSKANKLDVVLTDLHLPETDTQGLIANVRELIGARVVLLGMSGSEPEEEIRRSLDGFLLKPFSMEDFFSAVDRGRNATGALEQNAQEPLENPEMPVLDRSIYQRLSGSMPAEKLHEFYEITVHDALQRVDLIRTAFAAGDIARCRNEAHAIKGGCGMVGAMELRALAASIEAGATPDAQMLHQIKASCDRLQRMLNTLSR